MRRRPGFTLVELMVSGTLLAVLAVLGFHALSPATRLWNVNQARTTVEQTALYLRERLQRELMLTSSESVTISGSALSFLSFDPTASGGYDRATGQTEWTRFVVYCLDRENRILYRKEAETPRTLEPFALTAARLGELCESSNGTEKAVARHVSDLRLQKVSPGLFQLTVRLVVDTPQGLETRTVHTRVRTRN